MAKTKRQATIYRAVTIIEADETVFGRKKKFQFGSVNLDLA
jgi:hypothetical protein